jgi:hypothetical protein
MMMSLGPISISKPARAHFPTIQPVTPLPSTRMSLLPNQALERAEMALEPTEARIRLAGAPAICAPKQPEPLADPRSIS